MRRIALTLATMMAPVVAAQVAAAADIPFKAPVLKPSPHVEFNWTGFYLGLNYGTGVSQSTGTTRGFVGSFDRTGAGFTAGVQGGYNWQFATHWVAGIEADFGWLGISRSFLDINEQFTFGTKSHWLATARGRFGYTASPSYTYVTGGYAAVDIEDEASAFGFTTTEKGTQSGWVLGGGIETVLGNNWSAKTEYLYVDAGNRSFFDPIAGEPFEFTHTFHVFRSGLNYRLGGPNIPATALPPHNWNGFYVGLNGGVGISRVHGQPDSLFDGEFDLADTAFAGGLQAGYNWEFAPHWLVGVEGDLGWLGIDRNEQNWNDLSAFGVKTDWYGTLRVRGGYTTGPALFYVTGGVAFTHVKNNVDAVAVNSFSSTETATGWVIGSGTEVELGKNWTARIEHLYIDAGSQDVFNPELAGALVKFDNRFHVFRFGLNRQFND
jgi:outer membrane immunogenic protein